MAVFKKFVFVFASIMLSLFAANATQQQVLIEMDEYVDQTVIYNPLKSGSGIWQDTTENQSHYNLTGYLTISNTNPNGKSIFDIYISFSDTGNITLPVHIDGRTGTFVSNGTSSGSIVLHIPELNSGENSTWIYNPINRTAIRPPLNFTTVYSDEKLLAGDNITVNDTIENVFDNFSYQSDTCIYGINITQVTTPVDFNGFDQNYYFLPSTTVGSDASNVSYSADNKTQYWDGLNGNCLDKGNKADISYDINTPLNIPKTTHYSMINSTIRYNLNQTISHLRVVDITAISEGSLDFEKRIMKPSHPTLYGSNVTWNVTGYFNTDTNITYELRDYVLWVSQRVGVSGDPNTVDNDTISNATLRETQSPYVLVNSSAPWTSPSWLFNYSDLPSPIVYMDVNFTIKNDGTQLINRSVTRNGDDLYIKELYMIIGYWLEINKNITSLGNDSYNLKIDVHNKGNQVTPADSPVTIYDFVPATFNITSNMVYTSYPYNSGSTWHTTTHANYSVNGTYNGTLHQWALMPNTTLNTSFAAGPDKNENTTWRVEFNVTGLGDYEVMDVFITGLDPQQVDGAGSTKSVVVSEVVDRIKSTEGIFAVVASVLLLLGLLL